MSACIPRWRHEAAVVSLLVGISLPRGVAARHAPRIRVRMIARVKLGHGLGFPMPDTLMVLRHKILQFVDPVTLRERQRVRTSRFYRGFSHIEGSVVAPGVLFLENKPWIYLIRLSR